MAILNILSTLACPDCRSVISWMNQSFLKGTCTKCSRDFHDEGGIVSLMPSASWLPDKEKSAAMKQWEQVEEHFIRHYVYRKRSITERIHNLGHRAVENLRSSTELQPTVALDLASGPGSHFSFLQNKAGVSIIALDAKKASLQSSRKSGHFRNIGALIQADCYYLPFLDNSLEQVFSLYLLEHIADLDRCFSEVSRVLKSGGSFCLAIPTEGGFLWRLGRSLTTARVARRKYGIDYNAIIKDQHVSSASLILRKLPLYFHVRRKRYHPLLIPSINLNLIIVLEAQKK